MPVIETPKMVTGTSPVLVTVTDCPALLVPTTCGLKAKPAELKVSARVPTTPLPDRFTKLVAWKLVLLEADSCPLNEPLCVGRNAMLTVQVAFCASDAGQLFVCEKLALVVNAGVLNAKVVAAVLLTVTVWIGLAVFTNWLGNVK